MAVVGIDLGTTNTVIASVRGGRVHVLADEQGRRLLPSVVSFHPSGEVLVGQAAKQRRVVDAKNTIASVKRLIGRSWDSEEIRRSRARFAFELKEGPGQGPLVVARGQEYTLPEISAFVLRRARQTTEVALGEPAERAVITVPANFNELQRAATKVAGRVAGLDVLRIINEPTAAALAYGLGRSEKERIAVYDFGGGTFDCTLLDLSGNVFEVLATAGDTFLGGDDLDLAVAERMSEAFLHKHRYDPRADAQAFERLRAAAEAVKMDLSVQDRTTTRLREIAFGVGGAHLDLDFGMTRAELEMLATPLIERTLAVCQEALSIARLPVTAFDKIILVGGSTRIPLVRTRVAQFFGKAPLDRVNPEEVVAIGAAIQASALTDVERRRSIPPAPMPGGPRRTYPSIPPDPHVAGETQSDEDITVTASISELLRRTRSGSAAPAPDSGASAGSVPASGSAGSTANAPAVPRTTTQKMGGPTPGPAPHGPTGTARLASGPSGTARMPSAPPLPVDGRPPPLHDPAPTLPRPVAYADIARSSDPNGVPDPLPQARSSQPSDGALQSMPELPPPPAAIAIPVLVDVTPRALVVETVGGYCDVVVQRNAKIPCERTRAFTTSSDNQELVRVRVAQGEDPLFGGNTFLGQVELVGLRAAPRGEVVVQVRFEVDEGGSLRVFATDVATGREAHALLQLVGIAGIKSIESMQARHAGTRVV
jgi:molecular chaperone DnaK